MREVKVDDVIGVVAYDDDIGREYREPDGRLRKVLQDWSAEDENPGGQAPLEGEVNR